MSGEKPKHVISGKRKARAASENIYNSWKLKHRKPKSYIILIIVPAQLKHEVKHCETVMG